jgi:hypothetical protein
VAAYGIVTKPRTAAAHVFRKERILPPSEKEMGKRIRGGDTMRIPTALSSSKYEFGTNPDGRPDKGNDPGTVENKIPARRRKATK